MALLSGGEKYKTGHSEKEAGHKQTTTKNSKGLGDDLVKDLSLDPQYPCKKLGMAAYAYNLSTGEQRQEEPQAVLVS